MSDSLSVLVSGATGQQGGALARLLLEKGHRVRAFVRRPDSPKAKELERLGPEPTGGGVGERRAVPRARLLLEKGQRVRAFVRRPDSPKAKELERLGPELTEGDFEEPST